MPRQQRRQLQLLRHLHGLGLILTGAVQQLLLHRIGHEQRPCVLGQHTQPLTLCQLHLATIGLLEIRQRLQQRGLARAVAAQQAQQLALPERHIRAAKNVFAFFGISEPKFLALQNSRALCFFLGFCSFRRGDFLRDGQQPLQAAAAIPHRQGQLVRLLQLTENTDSGRQSEVNAALFRAAGQLPRDLSRCTI